jgi:hypothetical protein
MSSEVETSLDSSACSVLRNVQRFLDSARNDKTIYSTAWLAASVMERLCIRIADNLCRMTYVNRIL